LGVEQHSIDHLHNRQRRTEYVKTIAKAVRSIDIVQATCENVQLRAHWNLPRMVIDEVPHMPVDIFVVPYHLTGAVDVLRRGVQNVVYAWNENQIIERQGI
jgi:hypothetical protein